MHRKLALVSTPLVLALAIGACGNGDDEKQAPRAAFELTGSGDGARMSGPRSVGAGAVRVDFRNASDDEGGVTLIRIQGDHPAAEAVTAAAAWGDGAKPLPEWVRFVGGLSSIPPGERSTSVQNVSAGSYAAVDINTNAFVAFEVTGDGEGELPSTSGTIEAKEYSFETSGLEAGESRVLFTNRGKQPHFALAAPIKPGKTIEDVKKSLAEEGEGEGEAPSEKEDPVDENDPSAFDTPIFDGGGKQVLSLELKKGKYALVCFIPDRAGGPPHVAKGMISEAVVE